MGINDLKNSLSKVLLIKSFDHSISVMELVTSTASKPSCCFLFHVLDLRQAPVMSVTTNVQVGVTLEPSHFILGMKRIPLAVSSHVVRRMYSTLSAIWKPKTDSSLPILTNGVTRRNPFQRVSRARPHVMVAANENKRIHLVYQPLN